MSVDTTLPGGLRPVLTASLARLRDYVGRGDAAARRAALTLSEDLLRSLKLNDLSPGNALSGAERSAIWLARAQACEAVGGSRGLEESLRATAEAIVACVRPAETERGPAVRRALGLAWMNRGNVFRARARAGDLDAAVGAYDQAIAAFAPLSAEGDPAARNSLGAAWLNRGQALQCLATPADLRGAVAACECAIAILAGLPLEGNRWYRVNLAGAQVNLANAALDLARISGEAKSRGTVLSAACEAARAARATIAPVEDHDPVEAELGLKAWRVLACVLGECLARADTMVSAAQRRAWVDEVSEAVEGGLRCVERWEPRGVQAFRPLAARLFRLGLQLYRAYQPQFLAEFVLEMLDPPQRDGVTGLAADAELIAAAEESIAGASSDLRTQHRIDLESEKTTRLLETLADLEAASRRLAELRAGV